jgi:hypothetical protein
MESKEYRDPNASHGGGGMPEITPNDPFYQTPEAVPQPFSPEVERTPISVINGALEILDVDDDEEELPPGKPTIH